MSQTYRAQLSRYRLEPLHDNYKKAVECFSRIDIRQRLKTPHYVSCCPYCGMVDQLEATVRVGAKKRVEGITLSQGGYDIPDRRERSCEILIIRCNACEASVDPAAYLAPEAFVHDRRIVDNILSK